KLGRREFIVKGALAGIGLKFLPLAQGAAPSAPVANRYGPLGRTGLKISDISFGSSRLHVGQERLVLHAFDRGINYFDTADTYTDGESETTIGNALRDKRDKVVLASKHLAWADESKESMMAALEGSLSRLRTDHIDVYFMHAVNDVARLKNHQWYEFAELARKQGKIRFSGLSGHAGRLSECLDYAIDSGHFDVMLTAYNFGHDPAFYQRFFKRFDMVALQPELPRLIMKAKQRGMGVIAMKTLMGARLNDMRPFENSGATFSQAAFRWVLSNRDVDALIVTMTSQEMIDEYVGASGTHSIAAADTLLLQRYAEMNSSSQCRQGCDACESSCPYEVPIADVMRTRMYARDYGDIDFARREYAMLDRNASACLGCNAKPCAGACPHGVQTGALLAPTHRMLAR
ncbi:MAG TPA: aldo/keto reductase, partial [Candidatus Binataceae bacterium]